MPFSHEKELRAESLVHWPRAGGWPTVLADAGTIAWILSLRGLKQKLLNTEVTEEGGGKCLRLEHGFIERDGGMNGSVMSCD
ncbi:MAG: hypothetical protein DMG64_12705 [Acidobacteria bacterium]|nr:MAG: hypothetical protein DMG64_12705 [Acidobacteriota bacterium]PYY21908.1 MAG: hypothetical protein DMG62_16020 [Acidobacteriota bacterium]